MQCYLSLTSYWDILALYLPCFPLSLVWGCFQLCLFDKQWNMRGSGIYDAWWTRQGDDSCCHLPSLKKIKRQIEKKSILSYHTFVLNQHYPKISIAECPKNVLSIGQFLLSIKILFGNITQIPQILLSY